MIKIIAIIRPHRLEEVKTAVASLNVSGMTVTDVRGAGSRPEVSSTFAGQEILISLPIRSKIEVVCSEDQKDEIVAAILEGARTGEPGDGKIFIENVENAVRIRTGEAGDAVV